MAKVTEAQKKEVRELMKKEKPEIIKKLKPELALAVDAVVAEKKESKPASSGCRMEPEAAFRV